MWTISVEFPSFHTHYVAVGPHYNFMNSKFQHIFVSPHLFLSHQRPKCGAGPITTQSLISQPLVQFFNVQHHTMALHSALWAMLILSVYSIDSVWTQFYDCCCDEYGELYGIVARRRCRPTIYDLLECCDNAIRTNRIGYGTKHVME